MGSIFKDTLNTSSILRDNWKWIGSDVSTRVSKEEKQWLIQNRVVIIVDLRIDGEREKT